jgi:hypothetical protein
MNQELVKQAFTNLVRIGLAALLGAIATKYPGVGQWLTDYIVNHGGMVAFAGSIAGILFLYGQSLYTRMRMRLFAKQALRAEPGTTLATIDKQVAAAPVTAILTADPNKIDA